MLETESQHCVMYMLLASLLIRVTKSAAFKVVSTIPKSWEVVIERLYLCLLESGRHPGYNPGGRVRFINRMKIRTGARRLPDLAGSLPVGQVSINWCSELNLFCCDSFMILPFVFSVND